MENYIDYTPCPTDTGWSAQNPLHDDITGALNYTTELKAALRNVAPRRRTSIRPRLQVLELVAEPCLSERARHNVLQEHKVTFNNPTRRDDSTRLPHSEIMKQQIDKDSARNYASSVVNPAQNASRICKKPRRRTIYVPSDDTTLATIHPGFQSDCAMLSGSLEQTKAVEQTTRLDQDAKKADKDGTRRRSLAAAPRRPPLVTTLQPLQETTDQCDLNGTNTGKENVAPGLALGFKAKAHHENSRKARRGSIFQTGTEDHRSNPSGLEDYQVLQSGIAEQLSANLQNIQKIQQPFCHIDNIERDRKSVRRASMMKRRNSIYYGTSWKASASSESSRKLAKPPIPVSPIGPTQQVSSARIHYQTLSEDIERPEMFEDAWLSCQEFAIQQLLNRFFDTAAERTKVNQLDRCGIRVRALQLYQDCDSAIIFKRLNASLLYGALNPSKDSIEEIQRLQSDVGLRKAFLDLWLSSYDLEALISVAEIVFGRNISLSPPQDSQIPRDRKEVNKEHLRSIRAFIESCLLRNEDAQENFDGPTPVWCWRRTMLRSLMMVLLLDRVKEGGLLHRNLFQSTSKFKTSKKVLEKLCSLVSPFLGDVTRPLAHLHYHLHHVQNPLSEYEYGISNLATSLRDGVQLTHLVELLFHCDGRLIRSSEDADAEIPYDDIFTSSQDARNPWPLSRHLKVPCVTWSQKAYNVQVALSALSGLCGSDGILEGIKAEDIVNGHREKTITLLWSLVGKWGLEHMIDFKDVQREIRRLSGKSALQEGFELRKESSSQGLEHFQHSDLLQQWARSVANLRGITMSNLTTSFSDGQVFAAIVDEYGRFLPKACLSRAEKTSQLTTRLKEIGCSDAFGNYFLRRVHQFHMLTRFHSKHIRSERPKTYPPSRLHDIGISLSLLSTSIRIQTRNCRNSDF